MVPTARCTRQGCTATFDPSTPRSGDECTFHPGAPVFHEGLKSWSCCKDLPGHKPVPDFDEFMKIPGCSNGEHTLSASPASPAPSPSQSTTHSAADAAPQTFSSVPVFNPPARAAASPAVRAASPAPAKEPAAVVEDNDDLAREVPVGTRCRRRGCGKVWEGGERKEREEEGCNWHPGPPVFHEGSQGYACCRPRTLHFDDFLAIPGCRPAKRHLFFEPQAQAGEAATHVPARVDWYQTPRTVIVSVFAKGAQEREGAVVFGEKEVKLDLDLPEGKKHVRTLPLSAEIKPAESSAKFMKTKVELTLQKATATPWNVLEPLPEHAALPPAYALTFGVQGRTGSVGAREAVVSGENAR